MTTEEPAAPPAASPNPAGRILSGLVLGLPAVACCLSQQALLTFHTFLASLQDIRPVGPSQSEFVGLANYVRVAADPRFLSALGFTVQIVLVRVLAVAIVPVIFGLGLAAVGRGLRIALRTAFTIPLALFAPVAIAITCRLMTSPGIGVTADPLFARPGPARLALLLIDGLLTMGIACAIGSIVYSAAARGGEASRGRAFAVGAVAAASVLGAVASGLQAFTLPFVATGGGPANQTSTLGVWVYTAAFRFLEFGLGASGASFIILGAGAAGVLAGLVLILGKVQLTTVPSATPPAFAGRRLLGWVLLAVAVLPALGACVLPALPLPWAVLQSFQGDGYRRVFESFEVARALVNTVVPPLVSAFVIQPPIAYLAALGISGLRPLGKRSEWLLLLFSPWLFMGILPLSPSAWRLWSAVGLLNTFVALLPPLGVSVPMLFVLALFFKGREPAWRAAQAEGQAAAAALIKTLILPSLPLAAALALGAYLVAAQDLYWPLIVTAGPELHPMPVSVLQQAASFAGDSSIVAAGVTLLWFPSFIFFMFVFGAFQIFYFDRLALTRG